MSDLRERLGLDKSIASRVARAVRMSEVGSALRELPATESLSQIVAKCEELGAGKRLAAQAQRAIDELDAAIADFPGNRTALVTAIAATESGRGSTGRAAVPKVSEAKLRAAKRAKAEELTTTQTKREFAQLGQAGIVAGLLVGGAFVLFLVSRSAR